MKRLMAVSMALCLFGLAFNSSFASSIAACGPEKYQLIFVCCHDASSRSMAYQWMGPGRTIETNLSEFCQRSIGQKGVVASNACNMDTLVTNSDIGFDTIRGTVVHTGRYKSIKVFCKEQAKANEVRILK